MCLVVHVLTSMSVLYVGWCLCVFGSGSHCVRQAFVSLCWSMGAAASLG